MTSAIDRKQIRREQKAQAALELARRDYLIAAMSTLQGRAWFYDLLSACHIFSDPFSGNALLEAYSKGERNIGLKIFGEIMTHCPNYYVLMINEAQITETTNERRTDTDRGLSGTDRDAPAEQPGGEDTGRDPEGPGRYFDHDPLFDA